MKSWQRLGRITLGIVGAFVVVGGMIYMLAPHPPALPAAESVQEIAQLEAYLEQLVASGVPPSLSIAVVKEGKLVYARAFGMADAPKALPATPETVYHWWSMTKIVTAIAIFQLQEQGMLQLDDLVTDHLPWFMVQDPTAEDSSKTSPRITLRHLLNHSSGLPDTVPAIIGWVHYDDAPRNQSELVMRHLPSFNKLQFEPGSKAIYSNLNYMVLGAVIEAVSGQSYEEYVTQSILQPLQMDHTGFVYDQEMAAHEAAGTLPLVHMYTPLLPFLLDTDALIRERQDGLFWLNRVYVDVTPPTGLIGTPTDVARLLLAYLADGVIASETGIAGSETRLLTAASVATMSQESHVAGEGPNMAAFPDGLHGLGWYVIPDADGSVHLQHHGGGPGFAATMRLYPAQKLGIVILANGTDMDRDGLADRLAAIQWDARPVAAAP